jgi:hypothetical protein
MGLFKLKKKVPAIEPKPMEEAEYEMVEEEVEEEDVEQEEDHEKYKPKQTPKNVNKPKWEVGDVVTDTSKVIVNTQTGEHYDLYSAVVEILNRTE